MNRVGPAVRASLRRAFTENIPLKGFSLLLAGFLFFLIHGAEDAQRALFVDVVVLTPPTGAGKLLMSELPDQVRLTVRGSRSLINGLRRDEIPAVEIDLRTAPHSFFFEASSFTLPAGVQIVDIVPSSVTLRWENRMSRTVPIRPRVSGSPAEGLVVLRPVEVEPDTVRVEGAVSAVDPIRIVHTEAVDVSGLARGRHERRVQLERPGAHVGYARDEPVRVAIEIVPELIDSVVRDIQVTPVGVAVRADLRPQRVDIHLRGSPSAVETVVPTRVVATVDLAALPAAPSGTVPLPVSVSGLPSGLEVVRIDPSEVLVSYRR